MGHGAQKMSKSKYQSYLALSSFVWFLNLAQNILQMIFYRNSYLIFNRTEMLVLNNSESFFSFDTTQSSIRTKCKTTYKINFVSDVAYSYVQVTYGVLQSLIEQPLVFEEYLIDFLYFKLTSVIDNVGTHYVFVHLPQNKS